MAQTHIDVTLSAEVERAINDRIDALAEALAQDRRFDAALAILQARIRSAHTTDPTHLVRGAVDAADALIALTRGE